MKWERVFFNSEKAIIIKEGFEETMPREQKATKRKEGLLKDKYKKMLRWWKGGIEGWMRRWGDEEMLRWIRQWCGGCFLPVRHSKSEADKVIQWVVHHRAADSFMASRLVVRGADYNERKSKKHEEQGKKLFRSNELYLLGWDLMFNARYGISDAKFIF